MNGHFHLISFIQYSHGVIGGLPINCTRQQHKLPSFVKNLYIFYNVQYECCSGFFFSVAILTNGNNQYTIGCFHISIVFWEFIFPIWSLIFFCLICIREIPFSNRMPLQGSSLHRRHIQLPYIYANFEWLLAPLYCWLGIVIAV